MKSKAYKTRKKVIKIRKEFSTKTSYESDPFARVILVGRMRCWFELEKIETLLDKYLEVPESRTKSLT